MDDITAPLSNGRFLMLSVCLENWVQVIKEMKEMWAGTTPEQLNEMNENPSLLPPYPPAFLHAKGYLVVLDWQVIPAFAHSISLCLG